MIGVHSDFTGHANFYVRWDWLMKALSSSEEKPEYKKLLLILKMAETSNGCAMARLLMVEAILRDKDYSITMLCNLYKDLPSKLYNVSVQNKHKFVFSFDEGQVVEPRRLQDLIYLFT